jgi:hypothetical protein
MTPFTALSRAYPGTGTMRVRVVLRSGAVIEGDALDGDDTGLVVSLATSTEPVTIDAADITSVAVRERSLAREVLLFVGAMVVTPLLLSGLNELTYVFPTADRLAPWAAVALLAGLLVGRRPLLDWLTRVTARWRQCYPAV